MYIPVPKALFRVLIYIIYVHINQKFLFYIRDLMHDSYVQVCNIEANLIK